jgi:cell division protein FtsL
LAAGWRHIHSPGFAITLAVSLSSLVVVALLHVWTRLEIVRIGYALSEETRLHQALREHEQRLRLELAARKDPAAIERAAREQAHMAPPDPTAIRIVPRSLSQSLVNRGHR